ncbi:DivIVA domain-containing protein [Phytoactinopolyspora halophila]|uniref:DivIVA domain-containing protein n=1 Tax=Phytoactinopolyspora halophila TaxID=1981511 RepID=UPI001314A9DC|nr:DivIVA domain-containing protein [Phytoactinopolyspora halophila]
MAVSREPEFRTVRMREGYDLDAVDDFVDQVIEALDGRPGGRGITPERIEAEEFKVVRMREGYSMDDVDDWLDAAAAELRQRRDAERKSQPSQQHQYAAPAQHTQNMPRGPEHGWPGSDPMGYPAGGMPPAAPPAGGPPAGGPPAGGPPPGGPPAAPAPPAAPSGYPPGSPQPTYPGYNEPQRMDEPLTDSAVNELDPALRALETGYSAPAQRTHQQPAVNAYEPADDPSLSDVRTPSTGLHHVEIWTRDIEAATRSFGWLFERLGWTLFQVWDTGRSWQSPGGGPYVVIEQSPDMSWAPYDRKAPGLNHLALAVPERWMVDRIVSEAPTYGWRLMFSDRHPYAGGPHHYAAYFENEEGFEVEVATP